MTYVKEWLRDKELIICISFTYKLIHLFVIKAIGLVWVNKDKNRTYF